MRRVRPVLDPDRLEVTAPFTFRGRRLTAGQVILRSDPLYRALDEELPVLIDHPSRTGFVGPGIGSDRPPAVRREAPRDYLAPDYLEDPWLL
jgi:hypothetical protein